SEATARTCAKAPPNAPPHSRERAERGPGEVDRPGPGARVPPLKQGFNERDAAKIPGPKRHVAASRLGAFGGRATPEHRIRVRSQRSERLHLLRFPSLANLES